MRPYIITVILYAACFILTGISGPSWGPPYLAVFVVLLLSGLVLTLCITAWTSGKFPQRFLRSAKWGFSGGAIVFLLGYLYVIVETLIRA